MGYGGYSEKWRRSNIASGLDTQAIQHWSLNGTLFQAMITNSSLYRVISDIVILMLWVKTWDYFMIFWCYSAVLIGNPLMLPNVEWSGTNSTGNTKVAAKPSIKKLDPRRKKGDGDIKEFLRA